MVVVKIAEQLTRVHKKKTMPLRLSELIVPRTPFYSEQAERERQFASKGRLIEYSVQETSYFTEEEDTIPLRLAAQVMPQTLLYEVHQKTYEGIGTVGRRCPVYGCRNCKPRRGRKNNELDVVGTSSLTNAILLRATRACDAICSGKYRRLVYRRPG